MLVAPLWTRGGQTNPLASTVVGGGTSRVVGTAEGPKSNRSKRRKHTGLDDLKKNVDSCLEMEKFFWHLKPDHTDPITGWSTFANCLGGNKVLKGMRVVVYVTTSRACCHC
jgi:hypothetical protein